MSSRTRAARGLFLATVLLAVGCERAGPATSPTPVTIAADSWVARAVASTGDAATMVLVLDAQRWDAVAPRLESFASLLAPPLAVTLRAAADPARWIDSALAAMQVDVPALAPVGWDRGRPLVLALAEVPFDAPTGARGALLPYGWTALPGLRHQIVIPATDPAALLASIAAGFVGRARPAWAGEGTHAFAIGDGDSVTLVQEPDAVRMIVVAGGVAPPGFFTDPARPSGPGEPRPAGAAPTRTAGLAALGEDAVGLLVRPQKLPALRVWSDAYAGITASMLVARDQAVAARMLALELLLGCESIAGAEPPEVDDYLLGLTAEPDALRLRVIASLTPRGALAFDAGAAAAGDVLAVARPGAPVSGWLRLDLDATYDTLGEPVTLLSADDPLLARMFSECGANPLLPSLDAPLGGGRRLLRSLLAAVPSSVTVPVPPRATNGQFVVTEASAGSPRWATTMLSDAAPDEPTVRAALASTGARLGLDTHVHVRPEGARHRVLMGVGVDPREVFGAAEAPAGLAHLRLSPPALAPLLDTHAPALGSALRPFRSVELLAQRSGRTLAADLVFALAGDPTPRSFDLTAFDWTSPAPAGDAACGLRYAQALRAAILGLSEGPPDFAAAQARLAAFDAAVGCLEDHPTLARSQEALRRAGPMLLADSFADRWQRDEAVRLLEGTCARGDAEACARQSGLRAAIVPQLPSADRSACEHDTFWAAHRLAITPAGLALDGAAVPDLAALRRALGDLLAQPHEGDLEVALGASADMSFGAVAPLLAALRDLKYIRTFVMLRAPGGGLQLVPVALDPSIPGEKDELAEVTVLALDGETQTLVPDLGAVTPGGRLLVGAADGVRWGDVAAGLARSCAGAQLIAPADARALVERLRAGKDGATLDKEVIRRIVRAHVPEVRRCYESALARDPKAEGRVEIGFTITATGAVARAAVRQSTMADAAVGPCIADAVARWTFPPPEGGGSAEITYPFVLKPG